VVLLQERRRHLSGTGSEILRHLTNDEFWDEEKVVFVPTMKSGKKRISAIMLPYSAEGRGMFTENEPTLFHQRKEMSPPSMWKKVDNQELLRQHAVAQTKTSGGTTYNDGGSLSTIARKVVTTSPSLLASSTTTAGGGIEYNQQLIQTAGNTIHCTTSLVHSNVAPTTTSTVVSPGAHDTRPEFQ
jgi:hypothetical protein